MKRKTLYLSFILLLGPLALFSQQKKWTLEECIAHALQNNISIKQQEIMNRYQVAALEQSKLNLLPTLNGSASHNYAFGRALDETTYEFTENETVQSNNFYAGSNVTLFRGLVNYNTIRKNRYEVLASEQELEQFRDNISLNVSLAYLQILLNQELVTATESQVELTKQQIDRTRKLVEAGSPAQGSLLEIEAQAAREELQLVNMRNQLALSLLTPAQMLELQNIDDFEVAIPVITVRDEAVDGNPAAIYSIAEKMRPEIMSAEYKLKSAEYDLAIAKGNRSPRLSLGASVSTGYSDMRLKPITNENYPFREQLNDNLNYGLGLSLNIPIFNGWQVNTLIKTPCWESKIQSMPSKTAKSSFIRISSRHTLMPAEHSRSTKQARRLSSPWRRHSVMPNRNWEWDWSPPWSITSQRPNSLTPRAKWPGQNTSTSSKPRSSISIKVSR